MKKDKNSNLSNNKSKKGKTVAFDIEEKSQNHSFELDPAPKKPSSEKYRSSPIPDRKLMAGKEDSPIQAQSYMSTPERDVKQPATKTKPESETNERKSDKKLGSAAQKYREYLASQENNGLVKLAEAANGQNKLQMINESAAKIMELLNIDLNRDKQPAEKLNASAYEDKSYDLPPPNLDEMGANNTFVSGAGELIATAEFSQVGNSRKASPDRHKNSEIKFLEAIEIPLKNPTPRDNEDSEKKPDNSLENFINERLNPSRSIQNAVDASQDVKTFIYFSLIFLERKYL